ncbi:MAG: DNA glycosylase [Niameybacter sp.]|uniref:DNA-3-methyladenine glycosylase family protein n=1 Tax=Niameybacter sp. TaxID=2033640 RepID=UPI002FCBCE81
MVSNAIVEQVDCFDIGQILESGQVFRFEKVNSHTYVLVAKQKCIKLIQQPGTQSLMIHHTSIGEFEQIWKDYFDLGTDYYKISQTLAKKDEYMKAAIEFGYGVRILKQDPWEMLISFIISQNKGIPQIKQCIANITERYGEEIGYDYDTEKTYYTFPTPERLAMATEEELRACKVGFRAPYIVDACKKVAGGEIDLNEIYILPAMEAKEKLMQIKGVGPKVSDCILLFAYSKMDLFPTDVWIKRVIEGMYFEGKEISLKAIQNFAREYYGDLAGYAQQYLFFYGRENNLYK